MLEILGWVGSLLFSLCAVPQVVKSYKEGHSHGLSWLFLFMWLFGEIFTIIYVWPKQDWPLLTNYFLNMLCLLVLIRYKIWER